MRSRRSGPLPWGILVLLVLFASAKNWAQENPAAPAADPAPAEPAPTDPAAPAADADPKTPMAPSAKVEKDLPMIGDMVVPGPAQLINGPYRDWVVLLSDRVLVVESLAPRPNTIDKQIQRFEEKKKEKVGKEGAELEAIEEEMVNLNYLYVTVPGEKESPEYRIPLKEIREVIHHEDLMLRRMKMLAQEGQIDVALEFLNWMLENVPDWPGLLEQRGFLLMSDAKLRLDAGLLENALVPLEELYFLQKDFPGVSQQIGTILQTLALSAAEKEDYPQAHHHLERLKALYPENPSVANISNGLEQRAQEMLAKAEEAYKAGRFADAPGPAETAVAMWPKLKNLKARHKPIVERYQRMHVGVVRLTGEQVSYPIPSDAELREENLRRLPLFSLDRMRNGTAQYRTRYFNEWEPMDLGKRMRFELKQNRQPFETQPLLDAPTVVSMLMDRTNPEHPEFDERVAGLIQSIELKSPTEFIITFERVPSRLEAVFASIFPPDNLEEATGGNGFRIAESDADHTVFRRARPEPSGLQQYHLAEIVEHKYPSFDRVVQSLLRGEISMVPNLPDWHVRRLMSDDKVTKDFFILPYAVPTTHLVLFHPDSPAGRSRELRRALSYGVDREKLLKEIILRDPAAKHGRLIESPFSLQSYGNSLQAKPLKYDISAALAMSVAAGRSIDEKAGAVPKLRMVAPPTLTERAAAQSMIRSWKKLGIEVELVPDEEGPQAKYDLIYQVGVLPEPVVDWWPIVTLNRRAILADLTKKPDWLRQQLIELDRTTDWGRVVLQSQELHRRLSIDAAYLPLFEVDSFMVIRKNARGLSTRPMHCYDGVDGWILDAWLPGEVNK